jgi:hypothetical protein
LLSGGERKDTLPNTDSLEQQAIYESGKLHHTGEFKAQVQKAIEDYNKKVAITHHF